MEIRIKDNQGYVDAEWTIEDGVMVVSPKEEKFEPKEGDVITVSCGEVRFVAIFKSMKEDCKFYYHALHILGGDKIHNLDSWAALFNPHPATEEEKQKLFDKLAEEGWSWDSEKKELVKLKWKPKMQEVYFFPRYIECKFETNSYGWTEHSLDALFYNKGWCFKTKEECQAFCDKLNEAISQVKP